MLQALLEREIGPETKDTIVTAGQQIFEQGRKHGIQALLLRQLRQRFGAEVDTHVEQRIATASVEQTETWSERVVAFQVLHAHSGLLRTRAGVCAG